MATRVVQAPMVGGTQYAGDYVDDEQQGNFFTRKVGPLPMWAILGAGVVVLIVVYQKFFAGGSTSSTQPAVSTNPSTDTSGNTSTGTFPWDNLAPALAQIQANQQALQTQLSAGVSNTTSSTQNNQPAKAVTKVTSTVSVARPAPAAIPVTTPARATTTQPKAAASTNVPTYRAPTPTTTGVGGPKFIA